MIIGGQAEDEVDSLIKLLNKSLRILHKYLFTMWAAAEIYFKPFIKDPPCPISSPLSQTYRTYYDLLIFLNISPWILEKYIPTFRATEKNFDPQT